LMILEVFSNLRFYDSMTAGSHYTLWRRCWLLQAGLWWSIGLINRQLMYPAQIIPAQVSDKPDKEGGKYCLPRAVP